MFINGENRILYIKINGEFLPIGCLTGDSFSETVEMLNTTNSPIVTGKHNTNIN